MTIPCSEERMRTDPLDRSMRMMNRIDAKCSTTDRERGRGQGGIEGVTCTKGLTHHVTCY